MPEDEPGSPCQPPRCPLSLIYSQDGVLGSLQAWCHYHATVYITQLVRGLLKTPLVTFHRCLQVSPLPDLQGDKSFCQRCRDIKAQPQTSNRLRTPNMQDSWSQSCLWVCSLGSPLSGRCREGSRALAPLGVPVSSVLHRTFCEVLRKLSQTAEQSGWLWYCRCIS